MEISPQKVKASLAQPCANSYQSEKIKKAGLIHQWMVGLLESGLCSAQPFNTCKEGPPAKPTVTDRASEGSCCDQQREPLKWCVNNRTRLLPSFLKKPTYKPNRRKRLPNIEQVGRGSSITQILPKTLSPHPLFSKRRDDPPYHRRRIQWAHSSAPVAVRPRRLVGEPTFRIRLFRVEPCRRTLFHLLGAADVTLTSMRSFCLSNIVIGNIS